MKDYWGCETAQDAVAKVVVVTNPYWDDIKRMDCYYGVLDDAVKMYNEWKDCYSIQHGIWNSVELFVKDARGKWVKDTKSI